MDTYLISFPVVTDGISTFENIHASKIDNNAYEIENSPFYVFNVSYKDIVMVKNSEGRLEFDKIVKRGGHSTYRLKLAYGLTQDDFLKEWPKISQFGCTYEWSSAAERNLYSIDVPLSANIRDLYTELERLEADGFCDFEEAHYFGESNDSIALIS